MSVREVIILLIVVSVLIQSVVNLKQKAQIRDLKERIEQLQPKSDS